MESFSELSLCKFQRRDDWGHAVGSENLANVPARVCVRDDFDR